MRAIAMLPEATPDEVREFLRGNAHAVRRNEARGVIQFMGCRDGVIAQIPLDAVAVGT